MSYSPKSYATNSRRPARRSFAPIAAFALVLAIAVGCSKNDPASLSGLRPTPPEADFFDPTGRPLDSPDYPIDMMQVVIEAFVVEVDENSARDIGVDHTLNRNTGEFISSLEMTRARTAFLPELGGAGLSAVFAKNASWGTLRSELRAMVDLGAAEIRTRPMLVTLHDKPATIQTVDSVPYQDIKYDDKGNAGLNITYKKVGIKLEVTPRIQTPLADGLIELELKNIEVSGVSHFTVVRQVSRPVFTTSRANTRVQVHDGETLVVGGLQSKREVVEEKRVPLLGRIPLLSWAFKTQHKEIRDIDILFYITPHILPPGANPILPLDFQHKEVLDEPLASPTLERMFEISR